MRLKKSLGEVCESSEGRRKEWPDHCHGEGMTSKDSKDSCNLQKRGGLGKLQVWHGVELDPFGRGSGIA